MKVIDHEINKSIINDKGEVLFNTDLSKDNKWSCQRCGKCCRGVKCKKVIDNQCSHYDSRPLVCKLFPISIIRGDRINFIKSSYCPGWGKGVKVNFNEWLKLMNECYESLKDSRTIKEWRKAFK